MQPGAFFTDKKIIDIDDARANARPQELYTIVFDIVTQKTGKKLLGAAGTVAANDVLGATKYVRYVSSNFYGVPAGSTTLDRLDKRTLVVGNEAVVNNPSPSPLIYRLASARYVLAVVPAGTPDSFKALVDADLSTTDTETVAWVDASTSAAVGATLDYFNEQGARVPGSALRSGKYQQGDTVKHPLAGVLGIFTSRKLLDVAAFPSSKIPAPTGLSTDANWITVNTTPTTPTPTPGAGLELTAASLATTEPGFELSPKLAALGKGRLRILISPTGATPPPPTPSGGFPYTFPSTLP